MTKIATSLLAGTAFFGLAAVAQAADMGSPLRGPSVIPSMSETSSSGGWYLRGDIGYIFENKSGFTETEIDSAGAQIPKSIASDKLSSAPSLSVGLGYQFNDYLRGDITGEFISTRALQAVATYAGGGGTTQNTNVYTGNVTSAVIMANVYADLGKYSGLTPYVGAGVGAAYNNMSNLYENASWTGGAGSPTFGYLPGGSKWSLAWALHAGMSYDLSPNLKLDAGYSFKDLGEVSTHGASICATNPCNAESVKLKDLYTHSVHVGARWMLDAPAAKTPVYAAPVVAKY